tara:strand:- start:2481 stop:2984 length:504 start_codon:yes stop_codon:yes gene_type:complete
MSTQYKTYGQFNAFSVTGRIFNAEIVSGVNGDFLAVTVITNLKDGDEGVTVTFNNSNGLIKLFNDGWLPNGRIVTVTGHIDSVRETYETKTGELKLLQRPQIHLTQVNAQLGPMPADKAPQASNKGRTVVRPSQAAQQLAVTPEDAYAEDSADKAYQELSAEAAATL